jgi:excinuclease ABC subunit A
MKRAAKAARHPHRRPLVRPHRRAAAGDSSLRKTKGSFPGIRGFFAEMERKKYKLHVRVLLSKYRGYATLPRLPRPAPPRRSPRRPHQRPNICESAALTITAAHKFFDNLQLSPAQERSPARSSKKSASASTSSTQVGLDYLTLDRLSSTLSGGESQRIQLATSLGSRSSARSTSSTSPRIGLHTRDTAKLIRIMKNLRDLGNTILVVEHDPDVIRAADYLLDLGPGAGEFGGKLLAAGTVAEVSPTPTPSPAAISPAASPSPFPSRREPGRELLKLTRRAHPQSQKRRRRNPARPALCVTGVSGSGKSTSCIRCSTAPSPAALGQTEGATPASLRDSPAPSASTTSSSSTSRPSAAPRAPTPSPTSRPSTLIRELFAAQPDAKRKLSSPRPLLLQRSRRPLRPAKATAPSPSRCSSSPTSNCPAKNATEPATSPILDVKYKARTSTTSST